MNEYATGLTNLKVLHYVITEIISIIRLGKPTGMFAKKVRGALSGTRGLIFIVLVWIFQHFPSTCALLVLDDSLQ